MMLNVIILYVVSTEEQVTLLLLPHCKIENVRFNPVSTKPKKPLYDSHPSLSLLAEQMIHIFVSINHSAKPVPNRRYLDRTYLFRSKTEINIKITDSKYNENLKTKMTGLVKIQSHSPTQTLIYK